MAVIARVAVNCLLGKMVCGVGVGNEGCDDDDIEDGNVGDNVGVSVESGMGVAVGGRVIVGEGVRVGVGSVRRISKS